MANHPSAKKRIRQSLRRKKVNHIALSKQRTMEKTLRQDIAEKKLKQVGAIFRAIIVELNRSAHKKRLHKNKVNRKKSRLSALINNIEKSD